MSLLVQTASGPVLGFVDTFAVAAHSTAPQVAAGEAGGLRPVHKWLGVPFAQARRWERPTAPTPWTTPLPTLEFGPMFPQPPSATEQIYGGKEGVHLRQVVMSEDAHNLNIFSPADVGPNEKLPVLVWIYGGSLSNGSADRFLYDPTEWIRAQTEHRFIVVVPNYRVNIFGFFAGPDAQVADPEGLNGNYGLYDCIAAFEWVQQNGAAFGMDVSRVTAFGESAGALLVASLLVSRRRLFTRAIMQSGAIGTMKIRPTATAYPAYSAILNFHGTGAATPLARMNLLKKVEWQELLAAHQKENSGVGLTIEEGPNAVWNEPTRETIARGDWDEWIDSVIIGTNEDEGTMFTMMQPALNTLEGFTTYISQYGPEARDKYAARYLHLFDTLAPNDYINSPGSKVLAEIVFLEPADRLARAMILPNAKSAPVQLGAMHSGEIGLIFNTKSLWTENSREAKTAAAMGTRWAAFACTGNPDPHWKPFTQENQTWLAFNKGGQVVNELVNEI